MFQVSDKVVCVRDTMFPTQDGVHIINKGPTIYVIREVDDDPKGNLGFGIGLRFTGIYNPIHAPTGLEYSYLAMRFRKLTDIQEENRLKKTQQLVTHETHEMPSRLLQPQGSPQYPTEV